MYNKWNFVSLNNSFKHFVILEDYIKIKGHKKIIVFLSVLWIISIKFTLAVVSIFLIVSVEHCRLHESNHNTTFNSSPDITERFHALRTRFDWGAAIERFKDIYLRTLFCGWRQPLWFITTALSAMVFLLLI